MYSSPHPAPARLYIRPARRGSHKIFIGMAPGVGKTYKMLEEAHQLKQEGVDIVLSLLETHGRKETADKAAGLEMVPRQIIVKNDMALAADGERFLYPKFNEADSV
jgi:two-component system sensor histidine kinase KdpD